MGNFTASEIFTILIIILVVFGPHRLPELARKAGALASKARSAVDTLKTDLNAEYGEVITPLREARNEIRGAGKEIRGQVASVGKEVTDAGQSLKKAAEGSINEIAAANAMKPEPKDADPSSAAPSNGSTPPSEQATPAEAANPVQPTAQADDPDVAGATDNG